MALEVYKFGGASVKDSAGFKNVVDIIKSRKEKKTLVVVSATGKTTNALQSVVKDHYDSTKNPFDTLEEIKKSHFQMIEGLFDNSSELLLDIQEAFVEIEWMLEEDPHENYDFEYDQIVSVGELLSSKILAKKLEVENEKAAWLDVRDVLLTDNTYREAKVDWKATSKKIQSKVNALFEKHDVVVTQGFIGASSENFTTTLGREGSDFTASIFSFCLDATSMSIWKDVPGILTGDPRLFENVTKIDRLSYREAIEMTYYGAKVIHPKTIKPVQNKGIPLHVKSFKDPTGSGTVISDVSDISYPPIVVFEHNQCLIRIASKDFSFVAEDHLRQIFELVSKHRVKIKMMKNTAVSFIISVDDHVQRIEKLVANLEHDFQVVLDRGLELLTIRHFNDEIIKSLIKERVILFEERLPNTLQMVVKPVPTMTIKE